MSRRSNISVLGSYSATKEEEHLAYQLGYGLANLGVNVISGGQKGVMHSLSKGVHEARLHGFESAYIIGILPKSGFDEGNVYLDLAIPVGSAHLQNSIIPLAADLVIAIGGSAGTLAEIAMAWQFRKPIALLGDHGWAGRLGNTKLDNRREDQMFHFTATKDTLEWVVSVLAYKG